MLNLAVLGSIRYSHEAIFLSTIKAEFSSITLKELSQTIIEIERLHNNVNDVVIKKLK